MTVNFRRGRIETYSLWADHVTMRIFKLKCCLIEYCNSDEKIEQNTNIVEGGEMDLSQKGTRHLEIIYKKLLEGVKI